MTFWYKSIITCLFAQLIGLVAFSQNLVPNPSFEDYYNCPQSFGQWQEIEHWFSPYTQSADYFNACSTDPRPDVPYNNFGYQFAADGQAYVGMATFIYNISSYRELLAVPLTQPLQPGAPVHLCFKVAVGGFGNSQANSADYTCKGMGMRFFNQLPGDWQTYLYPNDAAIYLDTVPTDTSIWYIVSGTYIPDSAYSYLVIGNFFEDSLSSITWLDTTGFGAWGGAYAFIDDVVVSYNPNECSGDVGIGAPEHDHAQLNAQLVGSDLIVVLPGSTPSSTFISLYDCSGQLVLRQPVDDSTINIPTGGLPTSMYIISVTSPHRMFKPVRVFLSNLER